MQARRYVKFNIAHDAGVSANLPGKLSQPVRHLDSASALCVPDSLKNVSRLQGRKRDIPDEREDMVFKPGAKLLAVGGCQVERLCFKPFAGHGLKSPGLFFRDSSGDGLGFFLVLAGVDALGEQCPCLFAPLTGLL